MKNIELFTFIEYIILKKYINKLSDPYRKKFKYRQDGNRSSLQW